MTHDSRPALASSQIIWLEAKIDEYKAQNEQLRAELATLRPAAEALKTAVELGLRLEVENTWERSHAQQIPAGYRFTDLHNGDPLAATIKAITRVKEAIDQGEQHGN